MDSGQIENLYARLGVAIASARKKKGCSQETLASALQLTRTSITNIESGRQHVQLHTLYAISDYMEIPLPDLLPDRGLLKHSSSGSVSLSNTEWLQKLNVNLPPARVQNDEKQSSRTSQKTS